MQNSFRDKPLSTKADIQSVLLELWSPLQKYYSAGGARVKLGYSGAHFSERAAELEGFARPLWGLAPLAAGGGDFPAWELIRRGLANGTNPEHPEYWGVPQDFDQLLVEMAAIGFALAVAPEQIWQPLSSVEKTNLINWLDLINRAQPVDNNWLFFRVLVNLGLAKVGAAHNPQLAELALERLEEFYLSDGWYFDGRNRNRDYYIPFAFHFYGLIYARFAAESDRARSKRFRERAVQFAQDFVYWFSADGSSLPFGRSLCYRFAQGAFWGGLALTGDEALPWGVIKGLWLRHLRWWLGQPILDNGGILSIGYTYPNLNMAEQYNSPGSPYWAFKFFLPLALPETHPFWQAQEETLPKLEAVKAQPLADLIICRPSETNHVFSLNAGQENAWARNGMAKYNKFAYSNVFGFSVASSNQPGLEAGAFDSMLALSDDGQRYRGRETLLETRIVKNIAYSRWQPWPDVEIETWLVPELPWYIRVHRLKTERHLYSAEGGFAIGLPADYPSGANSNLQKEPGLTLAAYPQGWSGLRDLEGRRQGQIIFAHPNTNLLHSRTVIPTLIAEYDAGEHWLVCAVLGLPGSEQQNFSEIWQNPPQFDLATLPRNFAE